MGPYRVTPAPSGFTGTPGSPERRTPSCAAAARAVRHNTGVPTASATRVPEGKFDCDGIRGEESGGLEFLQALGDMDEGVVGAVRFAVAGHQILVNGCRIPHSAGPGPEVSPARFEQFDRGHRHERIMLLAARISH